MTLNDYLKRPGCEIILQAVIDYDEAAPIYLSDARYITRPRDVPANQPFAAVIAKNGMPRLSQSMPSLWGGLIAGSWGDLKLISSVIIKDGSEFDLLAYDLKGRSIQLQITGRVEEVPYSEVLTIFTGSVVSVSGSSSGALVLKLEDTHAELKNIRIPKLRYVADDESATFPDSQEGQVRPILLGKCYNVKPKLVDASNYTYECQSLAITTTITAVYDSGIPVAFTNVSNGRFRLNGNPVGEITNDAYVPSITSHAEILEELIDTYASATMHDHLVPTTSVPAANIGIYIDSVSKLDQVINRIAKSLLCWSGYLADGTFKTARWQEAADSGIVIGKNQRLGEVGFDELEERYTRYPVRYHINFTPLNNPAGTADEWFSGQGDETYWSPQTDDSEAPLVESLHSDGGSLGRSKAAGDISAIAEIFFASQRYKIKLTVPFHEWDFTYGFGDKFNIVDTSIDRVFMVTSFVRSTQKGVPVLKIEAVG